MASRGLFRFSVEEFVHAIYKFIGMIIAARDAYFLRLSGMSTCTGFA